MKADKELIKHMVDRFLGWRLPEDFSPDAGINFKPKYNEGTPMENWHNPVGTNLFDANQAEAMVRYMLEAAPIQALVDKAIVEELEYLLAVASDPNNIQPSWVAKITLEKRLKYYQNEVKMSPPVPRLKKMVELTLDENPSYRGVEARNSDIALMIIIWQRWYNVSTLEDGIVHLYRLYDLPREDSVKRIRAVIQNTEHRFMPTSSEILEKRNIAREYWEEALGYNLSSQEIARHRQNESLTKPPHFDDRQAKLLDVREKPKGRRII